MDAKKRKLHTITAMIKNTIISVRPIPKISCIESLPQWIGHRLAALR
jgi:hypothetical protein